MSDTSSTEPVPPTQPVEPLGLTDPDGTEAEGPADFTESSQLGEPVPAPRSIPRRAASRLRRSASSRLRRTADGLSPTERRKKRNHIAVRFDRQLRRIERLEGAQRDLEAQIARCQGMLDEWTPTLGNARVMLFRIENQMGSLETRVADLSEQVTPTAPLNAAEQADAVDVLAEIRAEHRRVRSRLRILASYEERIRRLEAVARATLSVSPVDVDSHGRISHE